MEQMTPVLVVTPHPDDAEGGAGGIIARWTRQGRKVVLVVCTNGNKGTSDRNVTPEALARIREEEQRKAASVLGIAEVVFLRFPDQGLEDCTEFREQLVRLIRLHRPGTVVTIDPNRRYLRHRDHYMCGRVTLDAIFPYARDHLSYPEHLRDGLEPHTVREVYLWGAEEPDTFLDVTDTFSTKMDALYCHASQMKRPREEREARTREYYAEVGKRLGVPLAESFKRIEIHR
ncbi:MAG TPA: PIG-L deacetylase family protein [Candidatus Tectomicrobia bacterium]|jgi:LmbE family N-acetylglucosaminyl deacetylase